MEITYYVNVCRTFYIHVQRCIDHFYQCCYIFQSKRWSLRKNRTRNLTHESCETGWGGGFSDDSGSDCVTSTNVQLRPNFSHLFHNYIQTSAATPNLFTITEVEPLYSKTISKQRKALTSLANEVTYFSDSDDSSDDDDITSYTRGSYNYDDTHSPSRSSSVLSLPKNSLTLTHKRQQQLVRPKSNGPSTQAWVETSVRSKIRTKLTDLSCCCCFFTRSKVKVSVLTSQCELEE